MKSASTEAVDALLQQARDFLKAIQLSVKSVSPVQDETVNHEVEVEFQEADDSQNKKDE